MPATLPPMTTRQVKKLGKKTTGQFRYTASQMRRADRREELEDRRRKEQEKERKKKENKRKRDEEQEKERSKRQQLIREGKIAEEDTWGKVTASQPRLNTFFKGPESVKRPRNAPVQATDKESTSSDECDSQEETLVDPNNGLPRPDSFDEKELGYIDDKDMLQLASSQMKPTHPTPPYLFEERSNLTEAKSKTKPSTKSTKILAPKKMLKRRRAATPEAEPPDPKRQEYDEEEFPTFEVAEDETAELIPALQKLKSPSRSVLSEMSVVNVNTRAQEKPDTTSAPADDYGLQSPSNQNKILPNSTQFHLGQLVEEDFDDDEELTWDKENTDPFDTPSKDRTKTPTKPTSTKLRSPAKAASQPESSKRPVKPGFSNFNDCEDIFDFDFFTGEDEFEDEEVDDATLMTMGATQKPNSNMGVTGNDSPRRLSPERKVVEAIPINFTPRKTTDMPSPPLTSAMKGRASPGAGYQHGKTMLSESFSSLADAEFIEIAEQVEEELSQKKLSQKKGKEAGTSEKSVVQTVMQKSGGRRIPWVMNPLPPANTQDALLELAEEVELDIGDD